VAAFGRLPLTLKKKNSYAVLGIHRWLLRRTEHLDSLPPMKTTLAIILSLVCFCSGAQTYTILTGVPTGYHAFTFDDNYQFTDAGVVSGGSVPLITTFWGGTTYVAANADDAAIWNGPGYGMSAPVFTFSTTSGNIYGQVYSADGSHIADATFTQSGNNYTANFGDGSPYNYNPSSSQPSSLAQISGVVSQIGTAVTTVGVIIAGAFGFFLLARYMKWIKA
jgi:hypothetical protein